MCFGVKEPLTPGWTPPSPDRSQEDVKAEAENHSPVFSWSSIRREAPSSWEREGERELSGAETDGAVRELSSAESDKANSNA